MTFPAQTIWTSSLLILAVLALRAALGTRISARLRYGLWLLPALRLCIPVSVQQALKLMPKSRLSVVDLPRAAMSRAPDTVRPLLDNLQTGHVYTFDAPSPMQAAAAIDWQLLLFLLWLTGMTAVAVWCFLVNRRFSKSLAAAREYFGVSGEGLPVYIAPRLTSPCLYVLHGQPGIYLPQAVADDPVRLRHVLAHEDAHFRHQDSLWSMVRVILLTVYWFHPLVWVMAFLSRRDCEQACDEAAIRALGEEERLAYGRTLVGLMAAGRPSDLVCGATTITDSKRGIKERVKRIAQRPQTRAAAVFLLAACVALGAAFTFTESPTHARACAMLKSNPPVSAYSFRYADGIQTYTALSDEQMQKAASLFLSIRNTEENPTYAAEGTFEWQLHFNFADTAGLAEEKQGISIEFSGMSYMLVHVQRGDDRKAYFVRDAEDIIRQFRTLTGQPLVVLDAVSPDAGQFKISNDDPDHSYTLLPANYDLENLDTGEGQSARAGYAEDAALPVIEPGQSLPWEFSYGELENGRYRLSTELTRDDGQPLEISVVFSVGEVSASGAASSNPFYKEWPIAQGATLTRGKLDGLASEYGSQFGLHVLDGFSYYAFDSGTGWRYYELDDGSVLWGIGSGGDVTLTGQGRDRRYHETAPGSGTYGFLPTLTVDDVLDFAGRGQAVRSDEFDAFFWEAPEQTDVDFMQFPVYDSPSFGADTGCYLTVATGGAGHPGSIILHSPDGSAFGKGSETATDVRDYDPETLHAALLPYLPSEERRASDGEEADQLKFNLIHWPMLSSSWPEPVKVSAAGLDAVRLLSSGDWAQFFRDYDYEDQMRFLADVTEKPARTPVLQASYSAPAGTNSITLYAGDGSFCLIQSGNRWACYAAPDGLYDSLVAHTQTHGFEYAPYTDAEIAAARRTARAYFEAAGDTFVRADYHEGMSLQVLSGLDAAPGTAILLEVEYTSPDGETHFTNATLARRSRTGDWRLQEAGGSLSVSS